MRPIRFLIVSTVFLLMLTSCVTYYKVRSADKTVQPLQKFDTTKYQFVMHTGNLLWRLNDIEIFQDRITGSLDELGTKELEYFQNLNKDNRSDRFPFSDRDYIYQVHIYASKFHQNKNKAEIAEKDILGIDVYNLNEGATTLALVGTAGLVAIGTLGTVLAIACTCPHVYTIQDDTYDFQGGLFTGAVSPKLERQDIRLLTISDSESNSLKILLKSDELEKQYINSLELMVVHHDRNVRVINDQKGNIYTVNKPILPDQCVNDESQDISMEIASEDGYAYKFNSIAKDGYANLYANFPVDSDSDAKLILSLSNTKWGGYVYKEFSRLFGWYYDDWVRKNQNKTRKEMEFNMQQQGITLSVAVKNENGWQAIDDIDLVGDAYYNTVVIPVDRKYIKDNQVQIRLQGGYMFWNIDYLALDNTDESTVKVDFIQPEKINNHEADVLKSDDESYMALIDHRDSTFIEFTGIPATAGLSRTLLLKGAGYYTQESSIEGKLSYLELRKFKKPAALSNYSRKLFEQYFEGVASNK